MKRIVRLTESDIERIVQRVIKEDELDWIRDVTSVHQKHEIGSHEDFVKHGKGTQWAPSYEGGKKYYDMYVEKFGPFTIYTNGDKKVVCQGNRCFNDTSHTLNGREEAAEYLGVSSLDVFS